MSWYWTSNPKPFSLLLLLLTIVGDAVGTYIWWGLSWLGLADTFVMWISWGVSWTFCGFSLGMSTRSWPTWPWTCKVAIEPTLEQPRILDCHNKDQTICTGLWATREEPTLGTTNDAWTFEEGCGTSNSWGNADIDKTEGQETLPHSELWLIGNVGKSISNLVRDAN